MEFWLGLLTVASLVRWIILSRQLRQLRARVTELTAAQLRAVGEMAELRAQVWRLEQRQTPVREPKPVTEPEPLTATPQPVAAEADTQPLFTTLPPPLPETAPEPVRRRFADPEWEAVVGGSLLSKVGALVLVVGIALFLGYTLTHLGAAGRIAVGYGISASLITAGIVVERRAAYRIFARSLLGAGWASLYFTTFALHGLPETRLVESPALGFALLLLVALLMIGYSLRYRAETVTGLAFAIAFLTLTVYPATNASLLASLPLALFLLLVADRFGWQRLAVAGAVLTYGTYLVQGDLRRHSGADPWAAAITLWSYWLLFEAYDLLQFRRSGPDRGIGRSLLPLNACGFVGLALLPGSAVTSTGLAGFYTAVTVAYAISTVLRAGMDRERQEPEEEPWRAVLRGGYETSFTLTALLAVAAISQHFRANGWQTAVLTEGELIVLAGLALNRRFLRLLGTAILAIATVKLLAVDAGSSVQISWLGYRVYRWTPPALASAALYFANRVLTRGLPFNTWTGSLLLTLVIGAEAPRDWIGVLWLVTGLALAHLRAALGWRECVYQAAILIPLGVLMTTSRSVWLPATAARTWATGLSAGLVLTLTAELYWVARRSTTAILLQGADMAAGLGATALAVFLWRLLPAPWTATGWAALGGVLLAVGLDLARPALQTQSYALALLAFARACTVNLALTGQWAALPQRVATTIPVLALLYGSQFLLPAERQRARAYFSLLGTALLTLLLIFQISGGRLTVALGMEGIGLLAVGFWRRERLLRLSGLALFLFCIVKLFLYDLRNLDTLNRILSFIVLGLLLLGVSWLYARFREQVRRLL